jgi:hypothetical protein
MAVGLSQSWTTSDAILSAADHNLPCPCTQCNARDRDFIPTPTTTFLNATMSTEKALNSDEDFRYTEITKK